MGIATSSYTLPVRVQMTEKKHSLVYGYCVTRGQLRLTTTRVVKTQWLLEKLNAALNWKISAFYWRNYWDKAYGGDGHSGPLRPDSFKDWGEFANMVEECLSTTQVQIMVSQS